MALRILGLGSVVFIIVMLLFNVSAQSILPFDYKGSAENQSIRKQRTTPSTSATDRLTAYQEFITTLSDQELITLSKDLQNLMAQGKSTQEKNYYGLLIEMLETYKTKRGVK